MRASKLLIFLRVFQKEELDHLSSFLASPYFFEGPSAQELRRLLAHLRKKDPHFKGQYSKEQLFEHLFPGEAYKASRIDQLTTRLVRAIERFIHLHFSPDLHSEEERLLQLAAFFRKRQLNKQFEQISRRLQKKSPAKPFRNQQSYWMDYRIAREISSYKSLYNDRASHLELPQTLYKLDLYYLVTKLEEACAYASQYKHHVQLSPGNSLLLLQAFRPLLASGEFDEEPLIHLYFQAFCMLMEEEADRHFEELAQALSGQRSDISFEHQKSLYTLLRNQAIRRYNEGENRYLKALFQLYQAGLDNGLLFLDGGILSSTAQNAVAVGLKLQAFDWVNDFLENTKHQIIGTDHPEEVYALNKAQYFFALQEYESAAACLQQRYKDLYDKLLARRLELKIYYEQEAEVLEHKIAAFKVFIFRMAKSTLPERQREGNNNFIDLLKQIRRPSTRFNKKRIDQLSEKIKEKKVVAEREWLLEKLKALY